MGAVLRIVISHFAITVAKLPHQGIRQQIPVPGERARARFDGSVMGLPVLGRLHHDYRAAA